MSAKLHLVTGATGLLGSHVVEGLVSRGKRVRALVRPGSDVSFLERLGVELAVGDLNRPELLGPAVHGVDVVYHCAARVSDWGKWQLFRETIIDTTRNLLEACSAARVGRFLHVSSSRVYGHPGECTRPLSEDDPVGQNLWIWEYYPRAKLETEALCRQYRSDWTIVRPTWICGPRDRNTLGRIIRSLELGQTALIGSGDNPLNIVFASDVAEGIILAAESPQAVGRIYNLGAEETLTQRQLLDALAARLGLPPLRRRVPMRLAYALGFTVEVVGKLLRVRRNLRITRHAVSLLASTIRFNSSRARDELGWRPKLSPMEGLELTLDAYFSQHPSTSASVPRGNTFPRHTRTDPVSETATGPAHLGSAKALREADCHENTAYRSQKSLAGLR